jgi:glycerol-3-phosphate cytidylyltransferase-like family protein
MDKTKYYVPMPSKAEIKKENRFIAKALEEGNVMTLAQVMEMHNKQVMEMHNKMKDEKKRIKEQAKKAKTNTKTI